MVLAIIFPLYDLPMRKQNRFYNLRLWIIMTPYLLACLLINSHVWYTRIQSRNMTKYDTLKLQVIHDLSCLPVFHPEIWDTQNRWKYPMTEKRAYPLSKRCQKRRQTNNGLECDRSLTGTRNISTPRMI